MRIEFRTKVQPYQNEAGEPVGWIRVPDAFGRKHCPDMQAWRSSRAFGGFANSDMFPAILAGAAKRAGLTPGAWIRLDKWPAGAKIDTAGFLAVVTIDVPDVR
jgi:hypothetical protein